MKRGALIVIEGVDRTGKTTQCKALVKNLQSKNLPTEFANFPCRTTEIGKVINSYLKSKQELPDETIHLLFSANRWEKSQDIIQMLETGVSVVLDRYCYSGVAFSAAKGLDINWCKVADVGLPRPDKVFFLTMPVSHVQMRNGFGDERYEVPEFQRKVSKMFELLKDDNWEVIDASRPINVIEDELLNKSMEVMKKSAMEPIFKLWSS